MMASRASAVIPLAIVILVALAGVSHITAAENSTASSPSSSSSPGPTTEEDRDCIVTDWFPTAECSVSCGGGTQPFERLIDVPNTGNGRPCPANLSETRACNEDPCPINCVVSDWQEGPCSRSCGGGVLNRTRSITVQPMFDGSPCPSLSESVPCNTQECPRPSIHTLDSDIVIRVPHGHDIVFVEEWDGNESGTDSDSDDGDILESPAAIRVRELQTKEMSSRQQLNLLSTVRSEQASISAAQAQTVLSLQTQATMGLASLSSEISASQSETTVSLSSLQQSLSGALAQTEQSLENSLSTARSAATSQAASARADAISTAAATTNSAAVSLASSISVTTGSLETSLEGVSSSTESALDAVVSSLSSNKAAVDSDLSTASLSLANADASLAHLISTQAASTMTGLLSLHSQVNGASSNLQSNIDALMGTTTAISNSVTSAYNSATQYTDSEINAVDNQLRIYSNNQRDAAVNSAKVYTDSQVNAINNKLNQIAQCNDAGNLWDGTNCITALGTQGNPAQSCRHLRDTGVTTSGAYYVLYPSVGVQRVYCEMGLRGGGWDLIMKAGLGTAFHYDASYWTAANTLRETDASTSVSDAKYHGFNRLLLNEVMLEWLGNNNNGPVGALWVAPVPVNTALWFFNQRQELAQYIIETAWHQDTWVPYNPAHWSAQYGYERYGINIRSNGGSRIRWGFSWNNENDDHSNDVEGGMGMRLQAWSGGDYYGCCGHPAPEGRRQYAFRLYGRAHPDGVPGSSTNPASSCASLHGQGITHNGWFYLAFPGVSGAHITYCDMESDGGGWEQLIRTSRSATFGYSSSYWTTANTRNSVFNYGWNNYVESKFSAYNYGRYSEFRAVWRWPGALKSWFAAGSGTSGLEFFQTRRELSDDAYRRQEYDYTYWSHQSGWRRFGINLKAQSSAGVRWGFSWNNEGDNRSNDVEGGIGMSLTGWSAGDYYVSSGYASPLGRTTYSVSIWGRQVATGAAGRQPDRARRSVEVFGEHEFGDDGLIIPPATEINDTIPLLTPPAQPLVKEQDQTIDELKRSLLNEILARLEKTKGKEAE